MKHIFDGKYILEELKKNLILIPDDIHNKRESPKPPNEALTNEADKQKAPQSHVAVLSEK